MLIAIAAVVAVVVNGPKQARSERGETDFRHVLIGMAVAAVLLAIFLTVTKPAS